MENNRYNTIRLLVYASISCLYIAHFMYCSASALPDFSNFFLNTDIYANLRWAETILEQGPLNPQPYHPYADWMKPIAPFSTWLSWWGNASIYQQSPLYTYFVAVILKMTGSILAVHFIQMIIGIFLCVCIGMLAAEVTRNRIAGLIASGLAGLYGPFYAYSWPLLRDLLSWLITAVFALLIVRWWRAWDEHKCPSIWLSVNLGIVLAFGLLARETFYLLFIIVVFAGGAKTFYRRHYLPFACVLLAFTLFISPLMIRNVSVGAPLLSTSNRFPEAIVMFNAPSTSGIESMVALEAKGVFERSGGAPVATVMETMALYNNNYRPWIQKIGKRVWSLLDPFEPPDNINIYYLKEISPIVKYSLSHVIIVVTGLFGLILSLVRREKGWAWFWCLLLCFFANIIFFSALSRYRQILCVFWIPLASYYIYFMASTFSVKRVMGLLMIPVGVFICIYISPKRTRWNLYRVQEFSVSEEIYKARGDYRKAQEQRELFYKLVKYK